MPSVPSESVIRWAAHAIGEKTNVTVQTSLHGDVSPWLLSVDQGGRGYNVILRIPVPGRIDVGGILTNAAALTIAEKYELPAPRLVACDQTGRDAGMVASLETCLPGVSGFPDAVGMEQLRIAGAAMATIHSIQLYPQSFLSIRTRPIQPDDYARDRRWAAFFQASRGQQEEMAEAYLSLPVLDTDVTRERLSSTSTSPLLQLADEYVRAHGIPSETSVFLHGDIWPGNTRWWNENFTAYIDWKTAGVGNPGVDLGSMRMQSALRYGMKAAEFVLEGWERHMKRKATHIDYWDAVAALNTPTVMEGCSGSDPIDHPLGSKSVSRRRDEFLRQAVEQLSRRLDL